MTIGVSPLAYAVFNAVALVACVVICALARRRPGPWTRDVALVLGALLIGEQISWQIGFLVGGTWTLQNSLPLDLCDFTTFIAAVACWWQVPLCVELTWFWGLVGTLQAVLTPDLDTPFPRLGFWNYTVEHAAIVVAALYLVIGLRLYPRRGAVARTFGITVLYAGAVAVVNVLTHSDYLFLRHPPPEVSLLNYLGPWPWYLLSCAAIAVAGFILVDLPFWPSRASAAGRVPVLATGSPPAPDG